MTTWLRDSCRDLAFLYAVGRHHHALSRTRVPRKHLACVIGGGRVLILLFAGGDSDRLLLGGGDGFGFGFGFDFGGSGSGYLSHGWAVGLGRVAIVATADKAGGDGERQRQKEEEAELHCSLVMRLLFLKRL